MFLHTVPVNVKDFERAFPHLTTLWKTVCEMVPEANHNFIKGAMMVYVRTIGTHPNAQTVARWVKLGRCPHMPSAWVTIRVILEHNGYAAEYPKRLGGKYSSKDHHPLYCFPWEFNLEINQQQLDWLRNNGWVIHDL